MFVSPRHCQYVSTDEDAHSSELTVTSRADMVTWTESSRLLRGRKLEAAAGRTPAPRSHPIPSRPARESREGCQLRCQARPDFSTCTTIARHHCPLVTGPRSTRAASVPAGAQVSRLSRTANERPRGRTLPRAGPWRCGHRPVAWRQVEAVVLGILEPSDPKATDGV